MTQPIKVDQVILVPRSSEGVAPGALFLDMNNNNALTSKTTGGVNSPLAGGQQNPQIKQMQSSGTFSYGAPLAKMANGRVVLCSSDQANRKNFIGYALTAATYDGMPVNVFLIGPNLSGFLTGLGFAPGDEIMVGEQGQYVNTIAGFSGNNDDYIYVGVADCPGGPTASPNATDLISLPERIRNL